MNSNFRCMNCMWNKKYLMDLVERQARFVKMETDDKSEWVRNILEAVKSHNLLWLEEKIEIYKHKLINCPNH